MASTKDTLLLWSSYPDEPEDQILVSWMDKSESDRADTLKSWLQRQLSSLKYALNKHESALDGNDQALDHLDQLRGIVSGIEDKLSNFSGEDSKVKIIRNLINSCRIHVDWILRTVFDNQV